MTEQRCDGARGSPTESADPRLDRETPLWPRTASAALLTVDGQYLLQLRDSKRGIFFPGHWGCFGGACDPGETPLETVVREIREELGLELAVSVVRYFTSLDFDLGFAGLGPVRRSFYDLSITSARYRELRLSEGAAMRLFEPEAILTGAVPLVPYDAFAIWLHLNAKRLR